MNDKMHVGITVFFGPQAATFFSEKLATAYTPNAAYLLFHEL
jgi:hypothetical protein